MGMQTVGFRITEEEKNYLYDLTGSRGVPISKFLRDLIENLQDGTVTYDGTGFKAKADVIPVHAEEVAAVKNEDVDLTELMDIAASRRVTPQSILNNALRPYRSKSYDVQSNE